MIVFQAIISGFFYLLLSALPSAASQGPSQPVCEIKGVVMAEAKRLEPGKGLSEGETLIYHDITINVVEHTPALAEGATPFPNAGCGGMGTQVFQKQNRTFFSLVGKCIRAKSQFSGDGNFKSGNWISDIEKISPSECQHP